MTLKNDILYELSSNDYVSGQVLADKYSVSRNGIWKAIKKLKEEGYDINAVTNKGYRLNGSIDKMSEAGIKESLNCKWNIIILEETLSTNNYASELALNGTKENTVVIAESQSGGRGRFNRNFHSPKGKGLYMSIIFSPYIEMANAPLITSFTAVAVAKAIEKLCQKEVNIKWVNDIYMNGKKICGILTEAGFNFDCGTLDYAVVGIGINVKSDDFPENIKSIASSIENESGKVISRNELCAEILNNMREIEEELKTKEYLDIYREKSNVIGRNVRVSIGNEIFDAYAESIDDNAALVVKMENVYRTLNSGEVSIKL